MPAKKVMPPALRNPPRVTATVRRGGDAGGKLGELRCDACGERDPEWRRGFASLCDDCIPEDATEDTFAEIIRRAFRERLKKK